MATYQELRTRSQQVRDEQNIGGNTALRVGQLLMDIVKYFNDNDEAASEYLQQHFAMVNDGTQLLNWQQSPIVILHTMGETYDEGDFGSLSQGENYYRAGFIMEANGQGGGINGETPKANVLYVNLANDTLYTWNGASFDAITSGGGGSISGDDIIKNAYYSNGNLVLIIETESGDKTVSIPVTFDASNYVPTSRTVNGKALSNNITLSQSDIPGLVAALAALVPQSRTINEKPLTGNVTIGMNDIPGLGTAIGEAGKVKSVTLNGVTPPVDNNGNINLGTIHDGVDGVDGEDGITPHIGQDGYWYIGTTNTGVKAQGERGNDGVSNADECVVVNNLDGEPADLEEGQIAVLGADQGKELKIAIDNKGVSFEVKGDTLFIRTAASPMVNVLPTSIQFDDTIFGNTRTATVHVYGRNLTSQVEVQVSGVGFSGSAQLLPNGDGKVDADVTITFAPTANTGTEAVGGRSYEGSVTAVCEGAESALATLEGFGVLTITPRITASIDKAALKGVLDTTADGAYTSDPATATLHVQASNINQVLTLAVDNAKFTLSESQISVEDALRGKDITVTYLRQSAVTATDDEGTITITAAYDSTTEQSTVAVSGATGAKKTSGTLGTFDGVTYIFDTWGGPGLSLSAHSGAVTGYEEYTVPTEVFDVYGYRYIPTVIETLGGNSCSIKRLVVPSNIHYMFGSSKIISNQAEYVKMGTIQLVRTNTFNGCSSLREVDMVSFKFDYSTNQNVFKGCEKLETVIIRTTSVLPNDADNFDKADDVIKRDYDSVSGKYLDTTTIGTAYYYTDALGNKKQKKLYVPAAKVSNFMADTYWGLFEVHSIDELSE